MDHLANSTAELRQGGKNWYVSWQGIPMNSVLGKNVKMSVITKSYCKNLYLSIAAIKYIQWAVINTILHILSEIFHL